jgi:single-stranded DNA-binding protein
MKVITIFGRVTKDCEVRQTDTGKFVTFSVAVNEGYKENQTAIFFDVAYNREGIAPYVTKGKQVTVHGDFKTSVYNDKTYLKIQAYKVELGGSIQGAPKTVSEVSQQNNRMAEGQSVADDLGDDEIPF